MTAVDQKVLFAALGFTAMTVMGGRVDEEGDERAMVLAGLIEAFCRTQVPEAFEESAEPVDMATLDRMVSVIVEILKLEGKCSRHELTAHWFSEREVKRHWGMARPLAYVALNRKRGES